MGRTNSKPSVDDVVEALGRWYPSSAPQPDLEMADVLLVHKTALLDAHPGRWPAGEAGRLLRSVLPARALLDADEADVVVETMRSLLRFLDQAGRLVRGSAPVEDLLREVDDAAPRLADALANRTLWAPGKALTRAMLDAGVDPTDDAAVQRWIERFNRGPQGDRERVVGPPPGAPEEPGLTLELPPRLLPGPAVLADAARRSDLLREVLALARWVGPARPVTGTGVLGKAAARQACADLGLDDERTTREIAEMTSARDVSRLQLLWSVAEHTGLLEITPSRAYGGIEDPPDDDEWLELWSDALSALLALGCSAGQQVRPAVWRDAVDTALPVLMLGLYTVEQGLPVTELAQDCWQVLVEDELGGVQPPQDSVELWRELLRERLDGQLDRLTALGALTVQDGHARLTDLGAATLREQVVAAGGSAPLVPDAAGADAGFLLDALAGLGASSAERLWATWRAGRAPADAAPQLLDAARGRGPADRLTAFALLHELGDDAVPAVRSGTDDPLLGPHARLLLAERGEGEPTSDDGVWMLVEVCAGILAVDGGESAVAEQVSEIPADSRLSLLENLWRVPHDDVAEVLDALGRALPDKALAKAARTSAFKARSRR